MSDLAQRMADLHARTQQARIEFLQTDLDLCFSLVRIAETERQVGELGAAEQAFKKAENGYSAIWRFLPDVEHGEKRRELQSQLSKLREALDGLKITFSA